MAAEDPVKAQFDILRKRAKQAATTATQQEREGLSRRFASINQVGSGAQIRSEAQAFERGAKRQQEAEETIGLAELGERQRQKELGESREFARGERQASQLFGAEQAGLQRRFASLEAGKGRQFATGERRGSQAFAGGQAGIQRRFASTEAGKGREFASGERRGSQDFARGEREGAQEFNQGQFETSADLQRRASILQESAFIENKNRFQESIRQFDLEFIRDSDTIDFNKRMSEAEANSTFWDDLGFGSDSNFSSVKEIDFGPESRSRSSGSSGGSSGSSGGSSGSSGGRSSNIRRPGGLIIETPERR